MFGLVDALLVACAPSDYYEKVGIDLHIIKAIEMLIGDNGFANFSNQVHFPHLSWPSLIYLLGQQHVIETDMMHSNNYALLKCGLKNAFYALNKASKVTVAEI